MYRRRTTKPGRVQKFQTIWQGPFRISEINSHTGNCTLDMDPRHHRKHRVFATDKLKLYHPRDRNNVPIPGPDDQEEEEEYEVERVAGHQVRNGEDYWHIKWKGYGDENNSWEPDMNVRNTATEAIIDFLSRNEQDHDMDANMAAMAYDIEEYDIMELDKEEWNSYVMI